MKKPLKTQDELIEEAMRRSVDIFSEEDNHDYPYIPNCERNYFYFPAIWYFRNQTITPAMIHKLQKGGNILSVGSGDGHLERLISDGFDIPKNRIFVSDIELDPDIKKRGFENCYQFDMTKHWPNLNEQFDYILFPESLGVALIGRGDSYTHRFFSDIESDTRRIIKCEEPKYPELFVNLIENDVPVAVKKYEIMKEALAYLKPEGEIIVCNGLGLSDDQQRAYVMFKLKQENPSIKFPEINTADIFNIKIA